MKKFGTKTFLENIKEANIFESNVMAFYFSSPTINQKNIFTLGGINPQFYQDPIKYYPVDDPSYWKLKFTRILIGEKPLDFCINGCYGFLDTGSTFISFHTDFLEYSKSQITDEILSNSLKNLALPKLMYFC